MKKTVTFPNGIWKLAGIYSTSGSRKAAWSCSGRAM